VNGPTPSSVGGIPNSFHTVSEPSPLDPRVLGQLRIVQNPGGPDLAGRVIQLYLDNTPALLDTLRTAIAHHDAPGIQGAAHSFKGSSAQSGALTLAELCKELETMGRANATSKAAEILSTLEVEYEKVRIALTAELHRNPSP
jgi:HPt (histidine-containing phosphotransfer) domain-containing protein